MSFIEETKYISDAIEKAGPHEVIRYALDDKCDADFLDKENNGFTGGRLLNIATAGFFTLQHFPGEALTERPLSLKKVPESFIGKYVFGMMNRFPGQDGYLIGNYVRKHFCNEAEDMFEREMQGDLSKVRHTPRLFTDQKGNLDFYTKGQNATTALVLNKNGVNAEGLWVPPGTIVSVQENLKARWLDSYDYKIYSSDDIASVSPLRLSLFAVPTKERESTFETPALSEYSGFTRGEHKLSTTIDQLRNDLIQNARPALQRLFDTEVLIA